MQFARLICESPEAFAARKSEGTDRYTGAWRAYHKALLESGVFVAGDPLEVLETGTTIRIKEGERGVLGCTPRLRHCLKGVVTVR